jgi:dethiobiotin synthetase
LELKQIGAPRKTKTALGETYISRIIVSLKDQSGKTISTNKGVQVTGTGQTEDDALANIDRQLLAHVVGVLSDGLPGLIPDSE